MSWRSQNAIKKDRSNNLPLKHQNIQQKLLTRNPARTQRDGNSHKDNAQSPSDPIESSLGTFRAGKQLRLTANATQAISLGAVK